MTCFLLLSLYCGEQPKTGTTYLEQLIALQEQMKCVTVQYTDISHPATDEEIRLIEALIASDPVRAKRNLWDSASRFILTKEDCAIRSYGVVWKKCDSLERCDMTLLANNQVRKSEAFDGNIVRTLSFSQNGDINGSIMDADGAYWYTQNRATPGAALFTYFQFPYEKMISQRRNFSSTQSTLNGLAVTIYKFRHPLDSVNTDFELFVDDKNRLLKRHIYYPYVRSPKGLHEIHTFNDYKKFHALDGKYVEFPTRIDLHYVMDIDRGNHVVVYKKQTLTITDIAFHDQLPRDEFTLLFPSKAKIYDGLTGLGWLEPGVRPSRIFKEERASPLTISLVTCLALFASALLIMRARASYLRRSSMS